MAYATKQEIQSYFQMNTHQSWVPSMMKACVNVLFRHKEKARRTGLCSANHTQREIGITCLIWNHLSGKFHQCERRTVMHFHGSEVTPWMEDVTAKMHHSACRLLPAVTVVIICVPARLEH